MEQLTLAKLMKMTSGYSYKIGTISFCVILEVILFLKHEIKNFFLLFFVLTIVELIILILFYREYCKIKRILHNGKIIHTKVLQAEHTYYGLKYILKLRKGDVYISSSYFDECQGVQLFFETYCSGKYFYGKRKFWQGDILMIELHDIDVLVNQKNYTEYVMILE